MLTALEDIPAMETHSLTDISPFPEKLPRRHPAGAPVSRRPPEQGRHRDIPCPKSGTSAHPYGGRAKARNGRHPWSGPARRYAGSALRHH